MKKTVLIIIALLTISLVNAQDLKWKSSLLDINETDSLTFETYIGKLGGILITPSPLSIDSLIKDSRLPLKKVASGNAYYQNIKSYFLNNNNLGNSKFLAYRISLNELIIVIIEKNRFSKYNANLYIYTVDYENFNQWENIKEDNIGLIMDGYILEDEDVFNQENLLIRMQFKKDRGRSRAESGIVDDTKTAKLLRYLVAANKLWKKTSKKKK